MPDQQQPNCSYCVHRVHEPKLSSDQPRSDTPEASLPDTSNPSGRSVNDPGITGDSRDSSPIRPVSEALPAGVYWGCHSYHQHTCEDEASACDGQLVVRMRSALHLIAAPMRPDGTWNRDREACRQLAERALNGDD